MCTRPRGLAFVMMAIMGMAVLTAAAAEGPAVLATRCDTRTVGLYEKFELRIDLRAEFTNPFDPDDLDL
jgi:hypothetical protein